MEKARGKESGKGKKENKREGRKRRAEGNEGEGGDEEYWVKRMCHHT